MHFSGLDFIFSFPFYSETGEMTSYLDEQFSPWSEISLHLIWFSFPMSRCAVASLDSEELP